MLFTCPPSGIKGADEDELREIASTPHHKHVYNVLNFDLIQEVREKIINEVCSGVDEQLTALVSGEESKSKELNQMSYIILGYVVLTVAIFPQWWRQRLTCRSQKWHLSQ